MVAGVSIYTDVGGTDGSPASSVDIDALGPPAMQFRADDTTTVDTTNDIEIPDVGTNYSFVKSNYLYCDSPPSLQIDNVHFYTDGANSLGSGIDVVIGDQMPTHNSGSHTAYKKATGTVGETGDEMTSFYTGITSVTSVFDYSVGSPKSISISEAGSVIDAAGETTNYFAMQMTVANTAASGVTPNETGTLEYDEV